MCIEVMKRKNQLNGVMWLVEHVSLIYVRVQCLPEPYLGIEWSWQCPCVSDGASQLHHTCSVTVSLQKMFESGDYGSVQNPSALALFLGPERIA